MNTAIILAHNHAPFPRHLQERHPVILLPVGTRPLAQHMLEWLAGSGFATVYLFVDEHAYEIGQWAGNGEQFGITVHVVSEKSFRGLRESLTKIKGALHDDFLVITRPLLADLTPSSLFPDEAGPVQGLNDGLLLRLAPSAIDLLPAALQDPGPWLRDRHMIDPNRTEAHGALLPVDDFSAYFEANMLAVRREPPFSSPDAGEVRRGPLTQQAASATITAPVMLDGEARIEGRARIGPNAIIGQGCLVAEDAHVEEAVVLPGTYVGPQTTLHRCVADRNLLVRYPEGTEVVVPDAFILGTTPRLHQAPQWLNSIVQRMIAAMLLALCSPILLLTRLFAGIRTEQRYGVIRQEDLAGTTILAPVTMHGFTGGLHALQRLPALWDVALGRIALIGIEPLDFEEAARLNESWTAERYAAPVGLLQPWHAQFRPAANPMDDTEKRILENEYAATRCLSGDLLLLWRSLICGLRRLRSQKAL